MKYIQELISIHINSRQSNKSRYKNSGDPCVHTNNKRLNKTWQKQAQ